MSLFEHNYCNGEGRLKYAAECYFDFGLDLAMTKQRLAGGKIAVGSALLFMTSAGDNWGSEKYGQLSRCFNKIADGQCPNYPS